MAQSWRASAASPARPEAGGMREAPETFDVAIVGFGPTGAILANLLGRDGLRTLVVERDPQVYALPRAVHMDDEVMRIFQSVGLAERILPFTGPVDAYEFRNGAGKVLMRFELRDVFTSQGWRSDYMFHQPSLERVLREGAAARPSVEVRLGRELAALEEATDFVALQLRGASDGGEEWVRARYLVGCDGAASPTRRLRGLGTLDLEFDEPWLVVDAMVDRPLAELGFPSVPLQHCDPRRPTTLIPAVGRYVRWEFMLLPGEGMEMREPERVRALVADWVDPDAVQVIRTAVYRFHALIGEQWRTRRVFLAGDAAHQMPPFLGQGMCAGIRDAANLAWKLCLVLGGRAGDALLDSYAAERAPHVRSVIDLAVRLGRIICTRDPEVARTRDEQLLAGGSSANAPPAIPGLAAGVLEPEPRHPLAGRLALQARVRDTDGRERLLDDVLGPGFALLWRDAPGALDDEAQAVLEHVGAKQISLADEDAYAKWLDRHGAEAVLVRPDHVVFGVARPGRSASDLLRALGAALV